MKQSSTFSLKPWQAKAAPLLSLALLKHEAALDMSDLGTGKTFTALEVAESFLPADKRLVVVAPKATLPAWKAAAEHFNVGGGIDVTNYERLRTGRTPLGVWSSGGTVSGEKQAYFLWAKRVGLVVFDEAHRLRSPNGVNQTARMSIGAKLARVPQLLLSATMAESLLHMRTAGFALGLHNGKDFVRWCLNRGCRIGPDGKLMDIGPQARARAMALHTLLIPEYGVRVRRDEIPEFPETQITAELIALPDVSEITEAYEHLHKSLEALRAMSKSDARIRDARAAAMVERLRVRQRTELIKVNEVSKMVLDAVEEGMSVVLFANFRQTLTTAKEFLESKGKVPAIIFGGAV